MGYEFTHQKSTADGKTFINISVGDRIIAMREEIEKNAQHAGPKFELVKQAFNEIRKAHGAQPIDYTPACSGCIREMNNYLKNWLALYDKGSSSAKAKARATALKSNPLKPVNVNKLHKDTTQNDLDLLNLQEKNRELPEGYRDLLNLFKEEAPQSVQDSINEGRTPKKEQIIDYLNNPEKYGK